MSGGGRTQHNTCAPPAPPAPPPLPAVDETCAALTAAVCVLLRCVCVCRDLSYVRALLLCIVWSGLLKITQQQQHAQRWTLNFPRSHFVLVDLLKCERLLAAGGGVTVTTPLCFTSHCCLSTDCVTKPKSQNRLYNPLGGCCWSSSRGTSGVRGLGLGLNPTRGTSRVASYSRLLTGVCQHLWHALVCVCQCLCVGCALVFVDTCGVASV